MITVTTSFVACLWLTAAAPSHNATPDSEFIALQKAVVAADLDAVHALVEADPSLINQRTGHGETVLHLALHQLKPDLVETLLDCGADIAAPNRDGASVLQVLAACGGASKQDAAQRRAIADLLLARGADLHAADYRGVTPLHTAALHGRSALLDLYKADKAAINQPDNLGRTPLHMAALGNQTDAIDWLIEQGADADATDTAGETPLHYAVRRYRTEAAAALLKRGAKVDARNQKDQTALHLTGLVEPDVPEIEPLLASVAETLLEHGADATAKDKDGRTPRDYALKMHRQNLADLLQTRINTD